MGIYLITGVTGFVGSRLAKSLLDEGHEVIGIARSEQHANLLPISGDSRFVYIRGDINEEVFEKLVKFTVNGVFHLASQQPNSVLLGYEEYYSSNVSTTLALIKYFKNKTLDFFFYASTISVFGKSTVAVIDEVSIPQPENYYGLTKFISEKVLENESKSWQTKVVIARFQSIFGEGDGYGIVYTFCKQMQQNQDIELYSNGAIHRNLIHIDDAIQIMQKVKDNFNNLSPLEIFQAASNNSLTTLNIANLIKETLFSSSQIVCSDKKYLYDWDVFVDISKAKNKLGYKPYSLEEGIRHYIKIEKNVI